MAASIANNKVMIIIMAILMVRSVSSKCSRKTVNEAYSKQVTEVVFGLQAVAPKRENFEATRTSKKGSVTGSARCTVDEGDPNDAINDCLTCLGWAAGELTTGECKGKNSGSSIGATSAGFYGACTMSFGPTK